MEACLCYSFDYIRNAEYCLLMSVVCVWLLTTGTSI